MEENTQKPTYLNYGQSQINQQDFLTAAANQVQDYVSKQPWSNKRKELFMKAYSDIMDKGVTGAFNNTGNWEIGYNGSIDLNSKTKKEREMYGEAAYFIQQQMSSITPKPTEDEKKSDLPLFDNATFNTGLQAQLGKDKYGGRDYTKDEWNERDKTNKYGIRETTERAKILAEVLENYANSLEDGKYNFEGSPYSDLNTLKSKMLNAANALKNGTWTPDTLNELGINPEQYLSTGANDIVTIGDKQMRRGDVPEYYQQLEADKLKTEQEAKNRAELAKKQQAAQAIRNNPFSKSRILLGFNRLNGWNPNQIANHYTEATLVDKLNELSTKQDWTPDEQSLMAGAYKHAPKTPISQEEYNTLKAMTRFKDASKSRFSKISGVDGIIYDSGSGTLIMAGEATNNGQWLAGKSDKDREKAYLESKIPGITNAEWKELTAIGADIASLIDPEPISAGIAGVGAAYLRHKALNETPGHKWTFLEGVGQGIDYLTGMIAAIPGFGDATLAAKVLSKIEKPLRVLGRVGAWKDLYDSVPGLKAAYDKFTKGEELTVADWRAIGQGIRGIAGHGMLNRTNRGVRKAATKSGYDATPNGILSTFKGHGKVNDYLARRGWIGTKVAKDVDVPTLKVKNADGKSEEIKITPDEKSKLEAEFKKTSKPEERTEAAKKILKEGTIKEGQTVEVDNDWRTKARSYTDTTRKTSDSFGTTKESSTRKQDKFDDWLNNRSLRSWIYYGSDSALKAYRSRLGITSGNSGNSSETPQDKKVTKFLPTPQETNGRQLRSVVKSGTELSNSISKFNSREGKRAVAADNWYKNVTEGNFSKRKPSIKENTTTKVGDEKLDVKVTGGRSGKRYKITSTNGDNTIVYAETSNTETLKKQIAEVIKRQHEKIDVEKIRELKKLFGLKHGGSIQQEDSLQDIIQNFLNNQK